MKDDLGHDRLAGLWLCEATVGALPFLATSRGGDVSTFTDEQEDGELQWSQSGGSLEGGLDEEGRGMGVERRC
jgi:hypothetical protein